MTTQCFNRTEAEERDYLRHIQRKIGSEINAISANISSRNSCSKRR
jgi:hypothetical protein